MAAGLLQKEMETQKGIFDSLRGARTCRINIVCNLGKLAAIVIAVVGIHAGSNLLFYKLAAL